MQVELVGEAGADETEGDQVPCQVEVPAGEARSWHGPPSPLACCCLGNPDPSIFKLEMHDSAPSTDSNAEPKRQRTQQQRAPSEKQKPESQAEFPNINQSSEANSESHSGAERDDSDKPVSVWVASTSVDVSARDEANARDKEPDQGEVQSIRNEAKRRKT